RVIAEGSVDVARAIALTRQILAVLSSAHREGIVHADVKSDNFLVDESGGAERVVLVDFGLARVAETRPAPTRHAVSGTPEYMAPEVIRGDQPRATTDLYGVGVI